MRYQLTTIRNPAGTYSLVGSVPTALCEKRKATRADVLALRAETDADGSLFAWHAPIFQTEAEAVAYCASKGFACAVPTRA